MKCPVCKDVNLAMSDRQGVEIDYCPQCRGVWLDRGELDKIIERSGVDVRPVERLEDRSRAQPEPYKSQNRPYDTHQRGYPRKRESFLSDLFDFD